MGNTGMVQFVGRYSVALKETFNAVNCEDSVSCFVRRVFDVWRRGASQRAGGRRADRRAGQAQGRQGCQAA